MRKLLSVFSLLILALACTSAVAQTAGGAKPCTSSALLDGVTATTQIVAAPTASSTIYIAGVPTSQVNAAIHICSVTILVTQGATARNFGLAYGTGTNCGTGTTSLTPQWTGVAATGLQDSYNARYGSDGPLSAPPGKAVCLKLSGAPTGAQVLITYSVS